MTQPGEISQTHSIDAPTEGWNAFDSIDNMPETAAIVLRNLIPGAGRVDTRAGTTEYWDLGTGEPCQTVASLDSADNSGLFAASAGGIWGITDVADVTIISNPATFSLDKWQNKNFRKADESGILILCNGVDSTQIITPEAAPPPNFDIAPMVAEEYDYTDPDNQVLNPISSDFIGVEVFKGRCYYWRDEDDAFYYTEAGSYQGVLARFPLGAFVQRGGKLIMTTTWTQQDSGDGRDDFLVFVFSTGEILVYQGDDPGGVGFFEFVGRYFTAEPLSVRGKDKYGSDIIIMTKDGYVGLSTIIQQGRTSDVPQFSRLIHSAIVDQTEKTSDIFGWDCILFPKHGLMVFNVPITEGDFEQHVLNTVTQRWCKFTDIKINCLEVHNERLFGGTQDGRILAVLEQTSDEGNPINFECLYAFSYLGDPGNHKHMTAAQVLTTHSKPEFIELRGYADFDVPLLTPLALPPGTTEGTWSTNPETPPSPIGSYWDEHYWARGGTPYTYKGWQNVSAFGYAVALMVRFAKLNDGVTWRSTTIRFNRAGAQ